MDKWTVELCSFDLMAICSKYGRYRQIMSLKIVQLWSSYHSACDETRCGVIRTDRASLSYNSREGVINNKIRALIIFPTLRLCIRIVSLCQRLDSAIDSITKIQNQLVLGESPKTEVDHRPTKEHEARL